MAVILYWGLLILCLGTLVGLLLLKKLSIVDFLVWLLAVALGSLTDGLMSDILGLYDYITDIHWLSNTYQLPYTFIAYPAVGIVYGKLIPRRGGVFKYCMYVLSWVVLFDLVEMLIVKPAGLILYHGWKIIPCSTPTYAITFVSILFLYRHMRRLISR
ncbi:hypothetical protein CLHUN_41120 [Ruminiclostridium hungatei]|uniref:Uncharacterized protein n=1 Tax=Ruminiclostridium hungatei TaxID=48256 RepID=A0A1V4SFF2_RUMHU|nr:CBO0543 family protein [Ruminiclostridium hungatei]OPX41997.1 hypothetical protein CLHUN_41120 [Ruminiclostridium hungatei]